MRNMPGSITGKSAGIPKARRPPFTGFISKGNIFYLFKLSTQLRTVRICGRLCHNEAYSMQRLARDCASICPTRTIGSQKPRNIKGKHMGEERRRSHTLL